MCMASQRRERNGGMVVFRSDVAGIGLRLLPWVRPSSNLTLMRGTREWDGSVEHDHGERKLGGAPTRARRRRTWIVAVCNSSSVLNPKTCHVIICIAHHSCVSENFDMHSLKQVYFYAYMCWILWMNRVHNLCFELDFKNPNFQHFNSTLENLIQNLSTFWGWA